MSKLNEGHPVGFIFRRETLNTTAGWKPLVDRSIVKSKNLFRKNLYAHFGCVNAIEFSHDGDLLISGGDDRRILLWQVDKSIHGKEGPVVMQAEHGSNVFALGMDHGNRKIFSAGNDDQVIVHDVETGAPLDYFIHEQPVYGVSIDPLNDNIFSSACDDGRLYIYDIREPSSSDPFCLASVQSAFHAVMFHPSEPRLIVSGNSKEGVSLWDVRKPKIPLLRYGGLNADQCCMSARFNSDGSKILALRRRLPPVLYSTQETAHLFQFNHTGYYNSCTMKSCCFAGTNDQFVLSGSDNFDLYMWKIPPAGSDRWVDEAHLVLRGHRSIVNQVRYNTAHSVILSSGVEKLIKVWSPFSMTSGRKVGDSTMFNTHEKERRIYSHTEYINLVTRSGQFMSLTYDNTRKTTREDPRMMAFFDALVQRDIEGWSDDSDNIAENSYAVISPPETSSSEESNYEDSVLSAPSLVDSIDPQQPRVSVTMNDDHSQNLLRPTQQVGNDVQIEDIDNNESDSLPSFEEGALILSQSSIYSSNDVPDYPRQSTQRDQLSTDDEEDDDDDHFKVNGNLNSDLSQISHADANIIKDLISKKHDRLRQLAKAHVVLETNLKKTARKRRKLYSSSSSSTSSSENENDSDHRHRSNTNNTINTNSSVQNQNQSQFQNHSSTSSSNNKKMRTSSDKPEPEFATADTGNDHRTLCVPSSSNNSSSSGVVNVGDVGIGIDISNSSNINSYSATPPIIGLSVISNGSNSNHNNNNKPPTAGSSGSSSMHNSTLYNNSQPYSTTSEGARARTRELEMEELSSQATVRNSYSEIPSLLRCCRSHKKPSNSKLLKSSQVNSSFKAKRDRDVLKRRKFSKFKRLRYEKIPLTLPFSASASSTSTSAGIGTTIPFHERSKIICSYHCQAQGRYPHPGCSSTSTSDSTSDSETNNPGNSYGHVNIQNKNPVNSRDISTSTSGSSSSSSSTASSRSSSSSSSSSSSNSDSSGSDSDTDTTVSSGHGRRRLKPTRPKPCSSPNLIPKTFPSTSMSSTSSSSDSDAHKDSNAKKIKTKTMTMTSPEVEGAKLEEVPATGSLAMIERIRNSPAYKLSPLIRRIETERLRKIRRIERRRTKMKTSKYKISSCTATATNATTPLPSTSTSQQTQRSNLIVLGTDILNSKELSSDSDPEFDLELDLGNSNAFVDSGIDADIVLQRNRNTAITASLINSSPDLGDLPNHLEPTSNDEGAAGERSSSTGHQLDILAAEKDIEKDNDKNSCGTTSGFSSTSSSSSFRGHSHGSSQKKQICENEKEILGLGISVKQQKNGFPFKNVSGIGGQKSVNKSRDKYNGD